MRKSGRRDKRGGVTRTSLRSSGYPGSLFGKPVWRKSHNREPVWRKSHNRAGYFHRDAFIINADGNAGTLTTESNW
jgi:hypothetical protein